MTEGSKKGLYASMLAVQQAAPAIDKSAKNPFFKSKYADLPTVWAAIREIMGDNNLLVYHYMTVEGDDDAITTRIVHTETKDYVESKSRILLQKANAQDYGSYITYMRRYALTAMLGLVTDEDDDGDKAANSPAKRTPKPKNKVEPKGDNLNFKALIDGLKTKEEFLEFQREYKDQIEARKDSAEIVAYFTKQKAKA